MRKGFTMVELLAVLAILVIILLIAVPAIMAVIDNAREKSFADSATNLTKIGESYMTKEWSSITKPSNLNGLVVTIDQLKTANYLENDLSLDNSAIVIYNNNGVFQIYVFANNGKYIVAGYRLDDIKDNVTEGSADYITALSGVTSFTVVDGQLTY